MFNIILIIISIGLITVVLLQQKNAGGGSMFGGGGGSENIYQTKRGLDKVLFIATIVLSALFIGIAFVRLLL